MHSWLDLHCQGTVPCLIDSGANINCKDADGMTPLDVCSLKIDVDLVEMLAKAAANTYAMDIEGFTAVHHARVGSVRRLLNICSQNCTRFASLRGKLSLTCLAPYVSILSHELGMERVMSFTFLNRTSLMFFYIFPPVLLQSNLT